jgi:hypothetical protein
MPALSLVPTPVRKQKFSQESLTDSLNKRKLKAMNYIFFTLFFGISLSFAGSREEAEKLIEKFHQETHLSRRLDLFSQEFLGLPYGKNGPLGEGPNGQYDQDPLYRFDTFDCTTFVETVMALALSKNTPEFETHLNNIRYENGDVDYFKRNHFTDLQWIPFNIRSGYLKETTANLSTTSELKTAQAIINFPGWIRSHKIEQIILPLASSGERFQILDELKSHAEDYVAQIARVSYIEINLILSNPQLFSKIPSGTVVNFIRPNWDLTQISGTHQNISHQGFLFRVKNTLYLRHASTAGKVEQVPFLEYLEIFKNHVSLKGIHLMRIVN